MKKSTEAPERAEPLNKKAVRESFSSEFGEQPPRQNHRSRGMTNREKKRLYARYAQRKKFVYDLEQRNKRYLILFLSSDGENPEKREKFYFMGGNSAIIYAYDIAPRIGRKTPAIRADRDFTEEKFENGMCAVMGLQTLEDKLAGIGIYRDKKIEKEDMVIFFKLNHEYTKDDVEQMLKLRKNEIKMVNTTLFAKVIYPDIHKLVLILQTTIYHKTMNVSREHREVLQAQILDPMFALANEYTLMAHGARDEVKAGEKMLEAIYILMMRVRFLQDLEIWDVATCAKIGKDLAMLELLIKGKIINKNENED